MHFSGYFLVKLSYFMKLNLDFYDYINHNASISNAIKQQELHFMPHNFKWTVKLHFPK